MGNTTTGSSLYEAEKNYEVRVIEDGNVSAGIRMKMRIKEAKDPQTAKPTNPTVVEMEAGATSPCRETGLRELALTGRLPGKRRRDWGSIWEIRGRSCCLIINLSEKREPLVRICIFSRPTGSCRGARRC